MHIEVLRAGEGPRLRRIRLRALADAPDAFGSAYTETKARPAAAWEEQIRALHTLVAVLDGADVGMVRGAVSSDDPEDGNLLSMWVAPPARRHGVGVALVTTLVDWARDQRLRRLVLDVGDHNEAAFRLYVRCGFTPTGVVGTLPAPRDHLTETQLARVLR